MAALQPTPQLTGWRAALQKIAPILGALAAARNNAGGSFAQGFQGAQENQQRINDQEAQRQFRLWDIIHQQQQEHIAAERERQAALRQARAEKTLTDKATKEQADKNDKLMRDEWAGVREGLIPTYNDLLENQGQEAADQYLASTHVGALTAAGLPHTAKDLVDRYAVRGPDNKLIDGKVKTPKEVVLGSLADVTQDALDIQKQKLGRPLSLEETQAAKLATKAAYEKQSGKDPKKEQLAQDLDVELKRAELKLRGQAIARGYEDKFGSAPTLFQDPKTNKVRAFLWDKTKQHYREVPADELQGLQKPQPPGMFDKLGNFLSLGDQDLISTLNSPVPK